MHVKVAARKNLKERFPIKVNFREVIILLVIEIGICESIIKDWVPLGNDESFRLVILR